MLLAPPDRPTEEEERVLENRRIDRSIDRCLYGSLVKEFSFVSLIKILYEYTRLLSYKLLTILFGYQTLKVCHLQNIIWFTFDGRREWTLQIHVRTAPRNKDFKNIVTNSFYNY